MKFNILRLFERYISNGVDFALANGNSFIDTFPLQGAGLSNGVNKL